MDIVELDRVAVEESSRVLGKATAPQWELPTPCGAWTLRQLTSHMAGSHLGFAAAAAGVTDDPSVWQDVPLGDDPRRVYEESARKVLDAFAEPGVTERPFQLPGMPTALPGRIAVGFHFLDYVVHAWDVAVTLGVGTDFPAEVVGAALAIAEQVPGGDFRTGPDAVFAPAVEAPDDASPLDRMVAMLGRSPKWSADARRN